MIGLLQRVRSASVEIAGQRVAQIGPGLLVLIGIQRADREPQALRLLDRLLTYRVFADDAGRMNRSLNDTGSDLLLVPQFTLAADTGSGTRAGFSSAAEPGPARALFGFLLDTAQQRWPQTQAGHFGTDMQVALVNDGPVTFWLEAH